jgi:hypothetical protein
MGYRSHSVSAPPRQARWWRLVLSTELDSVGRRLMGYRDRLGDPGEKTPDPTIPARA